nr:hypothetical protein [Kibdelosporangium sp. MJ126-NF4]
MSASLATIFGLGPSAAKIRFFIELGTHLPTLWPTKTGAPLMAWTGTIS